MTEPADQEIYHRYFPPHGNQPKAFSAEAEAEYRLIFSDATPIPPEPATESENPS